MMHGQKNIKLLWRARLRQENNIKIDIQGEWWGTCAWIYLAQHRDSWLLWMW